MNVENIDYIERDPNGINKYVKVSFNDVLAEPDQSSYSVKCIWENSHRCYLFGRSFCYNILAYFCSIPTALCWGCTFGLTAFHHVWIIVPILRFQSIVYTFIRKLYSIMISIFLVPLCETFGLILGRVYVQEATSDPPRPFMERLHTTDYGNNRGGFSSPPSKGKLSGPSRTVKIPGKNSVGPLNRSNDSPKKPK